MDKLSESILQRLVYVKYLLFQANNQRKLPRPFSSTTVLSLHDLVEIFLQLANEKFELNIKKPNAKVLETYLSEINKYLKQNKLQSINNQYIVKLNELRNQLKHASTFIDDTDIKSLYEESESFIRVFTPIIFNLGLEEISIAELILDETIKKYVIEADALIQTNDFDKALISLAKAFCEYESKALDYKNRYGYRLFESGNGNFGYSPNFIGLDDLMVKKALEGTSRILNNIISGLQKEIEYVKKVIQLGCDSKSYFIFKQIAPIARRSIKPKADGENQVSIEVDEKSILNNDLYTIDQLRFCFDFVLDSVLREQELENHDLRNILHHIMMKYRSDNWVGSRK